MIDLGPDAADIGSLLPLMQSLRRRMKARGEALEAQQEPELFEERLARRLEVQAKDDMQAIVERVAPGGRPPFAVKLSRAEQAERRREATPEQWATWAKQLGGEPDERLRGEKLAKLFGEYARSRQELEQDELAVGLAGEQEEAPGA